MIKIVRLLSSAIGTPLGLKASQLIRDRDFASLVALECAPSSYATASLYKKEAQVVALVRKLEGLPTGIDLHKAAVVSFHASERRCHQANQRLAQYNNWFERGFYGDETDGRLFDHLSSIRSLIGDVLGRIPLDLIPRLSGGSTYYDKGEEITIPHKMGSRPSVTPSAWSVINDLWYGTGQSKTAWGRATDLAPSIIRGNRFTSVPKDSKKNRGICIEPSLNVAYQLAVGSHIRDKLKGVGIQIKGKGSQNAQLRHRNLAKLGSVTGHLATIDLSNASDTISYMLVKLLLPKGWFDLLSSLRSAETFIEGTWIKNQKFSSMGNGFTFELETLIFYALAKSVSEYASAYGDDIILNSRDSESLTTLLTLLGLEVNQSKSFVDCMDPFRESCGGDFYHGQDVRPVYLKTIPQDPFGWMVLANMISRIGRNLRDGINNHLVEKARSIAIAQIPMRLRVYGPLWAGDSVLHDDDRTKWRTLEASHLETVGPFGPMNLVRLCGYVLLRTLQPQNKPINLNRFSGPVQLASALLGTPSQGPVPRDGISGYRLAWSPTVM